MGKVTNRQRGILETLNDQDDWLRPMDIGGSDGSHHSSTLRQLWKKGLVQRRPRGTLLNWLNHTSENHAHSFEYKITTEGEKSLKS